MSEAQRSPARRFWPIYAVIILIPLAGVAALYGCCFLFALIVPYGDSQTKLSGDVVGPDSKPLAGARVRLTDGGIGRDVVTDESGQFSVSVGHHSGNDILIVTVTKDGYGTYRRDFKAMDEWGGAPKHIVLEPEKPPAAQ